MAKPLGEKSRIIRDAIKKHPNMGNTELAALLDGSQDRIDDKLEIKAADVAQQRLALRKAAEKPAAEEASEPEAEPATKPAGNGTNRRGRKPGRKPGRRPAVASVNGTPTKQISAADLLDRVFALAEECGGIDQLRRVVERLAAR